MVPVSSTDDVYKAAFEDFISSNAHIVSSQSHATDVLYDRDSKELFDSSRINLTPMEEVKIDIVDKDANKIQEFVLIKNPEDSEQHNSPYICTHDGCLKSYKSKAALKNHIQVNHYIQNAIYGCVKCGKKFKTEYLLKKHITITCTDFKPYKCQVCGKAFKALQKLKYHEGTHAEVKPFVCVVCGKAVATRAQLRHHMPIHNEKKYSCFCGKNFYAAYRYKEHYKLTHDPNNPYRCPICQKNFRNSQALEKHKLSHNKPYSCRVCKRGFLLQITCHLHEKKKHQMPHPEIQEVHKETTCPICCKDFKTKKSMLMHTEIHSEGGRHECSKCGKVFKLRKHLHSHLQSHAERNVPCLKCGKKFKHEKNLKLHMKSHSKPHNCKVCGARFSLEKYLIKHEEKHKKGSVGKIYNCPHCHSIFPSLSNIKLHMEENHADLPKVHVAPTHSNYEETLPEKDLEGKIMCPVCMDKFVDDKEYDIHKINHEKPYSCKVCSLRFHQALDCLNHERNEHQINDDFMTDENLTCPVCLKGYKTRSSMQSHLSLHSKLGKYACPTCDKIFSLKKHLQKHVTTHTGKPVWCPICSKCFKNSSNLETHLRCHSKLFNCTDCGATFSQQKSLLKHREKHHDGDSIADKYGRVMHSVSQLHQGLPGEKFLKPIYDCDICALIFKDETALTNHEILKHSEQPRQTCGYCGVKFLTGRTLKKHLFYSHNEGSSYSCFPCGREFFDITCIKSHKTVHINLQKDCNSDNLEKDPQDSPFQYVKNVYTCSYCLVEFATPSNLLQHEVTHVSNKLVCRLCNSFSGSFKALKEHLSTCVNGIPCVYCKLLLKNDDEMCSHMELHRIHFVNLDDDINTMSKTEKCENRITLCQKFPDDVSENPSVVNKISTSYKQLLNNF